ncbi:MAG TPA: hypothetical protein VKX16_09730 [Chloroflexota bacterium]|nr:hypothetical protein [Chloroflexota bacterium]
MKALFFVASILLALSAFNSPPAAAASLPPPPPPPGCPSCPGPPPPPTPVPTVGPAIVVAQPVVTVHLAASKVHRGQTEKITVTASTGALVVAEIRYLHLKPAWIKGTANSSGTFSKAWKIPKNAVTGKTLIKLTVTAPSSGAATPHSLFTKTLSFLIVK